MGDNKNCNLLLIRPILFKVATLWRQQAIGNSGETPRRTAFTTRIHAPSPRLRKTQVALRPYRRGLLAYKDGASSRSKQARGKRFVKSICSLILGNWYNKDRSL